PLLREWNKKPIQPANSVQVSSMEKGAESADNISNISGQVNSAQETVYADAYPQSKQISVEKIAIVKPMTGEVKTLFGFNYSPLYQDYRYSDGVDILSSKDDLVKAAMAGRVTAVKELAGAGASITIDNAEGYQTCYSNLSSAEVKVGQVVKQGQTIGKVEAETGLLHFALKKGQQGLDPLQYLSY
ncbi:MAG TPA: M23 family metallopeptidase, partial [Bacillota bacterium]|nr:M23 family metallopeptidase [Bacillota bacterium]